MENEAFKKYKVLVQFESPGVDGNPGQVFEVGQEIEMPDETAKAFLDEKMVELVEDNSDEEDNEDEEGEEEIHDQKSSEVKKYMGKDVISDNIEIVNDKEYHSLTLGDGSKQLLSPAEYEEYLK